MEMVQGLLLYYIYSWVAPRDRQIKANKKVSHLIPHLTETWARCSSFSSIPSTTNHLQPPWCVQQSGTISYYLCVISYHPLSNIAHSIAIDHIIDMKAPTSIVALIVEVASIDLRCGDCMFSGKHKMCFRLFLAQRLTAIDALRFASRKNRCDTA